MDLLHISTVDGLRNSHKKWVEEILKTKNVVRESKWSQSIAVGSKSFVEDIKEKLGIRGKRAGRLRDRKICIICGRLRLLTIAILPLKMAF